MPTIGQVVIYRSRTGDYDVPAIVNCTVDTINNKGVELGHVPGLSEPNNVHLTVFTPGKPGMRRTAPDFVVTSKHGVSENVAGCYQEWDIPLCAAVEDSTAMAGTWRPMPEPAEDLFPFEKPGGEPMSVEAERDAERSAPHRESTSERIAAPTTNPEAWRGTQPAEGTRRKVIFDAIRASIRCGLVGCRSCLSVADAVEAALQAAEVDDEALSRAGKILTAGIQEVDPIDGDTCDQSEPTPDEGVLVDAAAEELLRRIKADPPDSLFSLDKRVSSADLVDLIARLG